MKKKRILVIMFTLAMCLLLPGCLMDDDEFNAAKAKRDGYRSQLQQLNVENETLNNTIAQAYTEVDDMSSQLALFVALNTHDNFVAAFKPQGASPQRVSRPKGSGRARNN